MKNISSIFYLFFVLVMLYSCSEKKNDNELIMCEKDTSNVESEVNSNVKMTGKINSIELPVLKEARKNDSITKAEEEFRLAMLEKQQVTEFKKTIFSKSIDLNFDGKQDLITIFIIDNGKDTITYLSFYAHLEGEMKNTFDFRFDEKIEKIKDITTFRDCTFVITAIPTNNQKLIKRKFKFINNYNFLPLN